MPQKYNGYLRKTIRNIERDKSYRAFFRFPRNIRRNNPSFYRLRERRGFHYPHPKPFEPFSSRYRGIRRCDRDSNILSVSAFVVQTFRSSGIGFDQFVYNIRRKTLKINGNSRKIIKKTKPIPRERQLLVVQVKL